MAKVRKAVITAAGRGTRLYPGSNTVQKELFPIVDSDGIVKPVLQIIIEEVLKSGIEEICIVANPDNAQSIIAHFQGLPEQLRNQYYRGKEWLVHESDNLELLRQRITVVIQETQEGYGHAVYQAREWVGDQPFVQLLGDHLYLSYNDVTCTRQMIDAYHACGSNLSSVLHTSESQIYRFGTLAASPYTIDEVSMYRVSDIVEKPTIQYAHQNLRVEGLPDGEYLCLFGINVYTPAIFQCLEDLIINDIRQNGEIQMAAAQAKLVKHERYMAIELAGKRLDMGIPEGLVETQMALALRSPYQKNVLEMCSHKTSGLVYA